MREAIGYLRVSTQEQGRSGLGLAAQRFDIENFARREGFAISSWHQDIQTGAGKDALLLRPALSAALAEARIDLSFVERVAAPTTLAFVMRGTAATGARYSFYLDSTSFDGAWPFPKQWPAGARHLHVGLRDAAFDQRTHHVPGAADDAESAHLARRLE